MAILFGDCVNADHVRLSAEKGQAPLSYLNEMRKLDLSLHGLLLSEWIRGLISPIRGQGGALRRGEAGS